MGYVYNEWLAVAATLPGSNHLTDWRRRAANLEARFGGSRRPLETYRRYQTRMKQGEALRFDTVKYLGFALLEFLSKDERGPKHGVNSAAERLSIPLTHAPAALLTYLSDQELHALPANQRPVTESATAEVVRNLLSLRTSKSGFIWRTSITKRLRFHRRFQRDITSSVWPNERWQRPTDTAHTNWGVKIESSSRDFLLDPVAVVNLADHLELRIQVRPQPVSGDFLEYTRWFETPTLNPLFQDELNVNTLRAFSLGGVEYDVYDGVQITEPTNELHYQCEFASEYGLERRDIAAFVARHTGLIDAVLEHETKDLQSDVESFGGEIKARFTVLAPRRDLFYGFGWRLPRRRV